MAAAPDALAATLALIAMPDGKPAVALAPCWQGSPSEGEATISRLLGLGTPIMAKVEPMPPAALFSLFEPNAVPGRRYAQQTRWLASFNSGCGFDADRGCGTAHIPAIDNRPAVIPRNADARAT